MTTGEAVQQVAVVEIPETDGEEARTVEIPMDIVRQFEIAKDAPLLAYVVASSHDLREPQSIRVFTKDYPNARMAESVVHLVQCLSKDVPILPDLVVAGLKALQTEPHEPLPRAKLSIVSDEAPDAS